MKNKSVFILLIFLSLLPFNTLGQQFDIEFTEIPEFKNKIISDIEQSMDGLIWVASNKSIYRFEGKSQIKEFTKEKLELKTHHLTLEIVSDANGNIWYSPRNDLNIRILNTKENKSYSLKEFYPELPFSNFDVIDKVYRDEFYTIYISVKNKGLYKFDGKKIELVKLIKEKNKHPIYYLSTELYDWFAYNTKIIRIHKETLLEENFEVENEILGINRFNNKVIFIENKFKRQNNKNTEGYLIAKYIKDNKVINMLPNLNMHDNYFVNFNVFQKLNKQNKYWINEKEYLKQIDENKNVIFKIKKVDFEFLKRYRNFFIDKNNTIWVINQTGLYKVNIAENHFKKYLDGYSLKSIFKKDSTFYISIFGSSLKELDSKNKIHQFKHLNNKYSFYGTFYTKDTLWVARYSRILRYNFKTKKITDYKRGNKLDHEEVAYGVMTRHPKTKTLFIGSLSYLAKIDEAKKTVVVANNLDKYVDKKDRDKINVRAFKISGDSLWIGTSKGLFLMNHEEKISRAITPKNGLPKNLIIQYIFIENKDTFWLGTQGQGLIKWNRLKNTFKAYTTKDGLSNNNVYSVFKDKFGFFWLPTDYGLNRFAPETLKNNIFLPDKINNTEFNHLSQFEDKNRELYLGGINGLTVFNPQDFLTNNSPNYNLFLKNIEVTLNDNSVSKNHQLKEDILEINSDTKKVELDFVLLDYKDQLPLQYQYKITPLQKEFIIIDNNKIVLPKLNEGKYKLHVKAQSSDGNWAKSITSIKVVSVTNYSYIKIFLPLLILALIIFFIIKKPFITKNTEKNKESLTQTATRINETEHIIKTVQDDWLNKLNKTILENMNSVSFGMEFLSDKMELGERQLQRRIKKSTNLTPNKYITEVKLAEAFRLIEEKEVKTVKELASKVGFSTTDYFSKLFKNKYHKNPSDLLKF